MRESARVRAEMGISSARRAIVLVGLLLAVAAPMAATASSDDMGSVRTLVAGARRSAQLSGLAQNKALDDLAQRQAARMAGAGRIFHNDKLAADVRASGLAWSLAGENVGVGPSVDAIEDAFMHSAVHRHNILDGRFNAIGVGVTQAPDGRIYVAQVFARLSGKVPGQVPGQVSGQVSAQVPAQVPARTVTSACGFITAEDGSRVSPSYYGRSC